MILASSTQHECEKANLPGRVGRRAPYNGTVSHSALEALCGEEHNARMKFMTIRTRVRVTWWISRQAGRRKRGGRIGGRR